MDIDVEVFVLKTRDRLNQPRIQIIEALRSADISGESIDGVVLDAAGAPTACRVLQDDGMARSTPASAMLHLFKPESASAMRYPVPVAEYDEAGGH